MLGAGTLAAAPLFDTVSYVAQKAGRSYNQRGYTSRHDTLGVDVCERYVYSGTLFSLRKRRIVNFIQACPSCAFG